MLLDQLRDMSIKVEYGCEVHGQLSSSSYKTGSGTSYGL
jgi:hypothetical protein